MTPKEKLSLHVEEIFKKYTTPGLHICDIATGGGKSYTIGKLTCEYYPKHFDLDNVGYRICKLGGFCEKPETCRSKELMEKPNL